MTACLSPGAIGAHCAPGIALEVIGATGSTNSDLLARLPTLAGPTLLVAERQTDGRGRAGRNWLSAPGASLTFSLAWKFGAPLQRLAGLPLAVGVALAEALAALDVKVQLKWPNDVLKDGAKLAGILIETRAGADGAIWAVLGVGLNLLMPEQLEAAIGRDAAAAPELAQMDRNRLMARLLDALAGALRQFEAAGFAAFRARWNRLDAHQGQAVVIFDCGRALHQGTACGVDELGRLLLDSAAGRLEIMSGDVSLRAKAG